MSAFPADPERATTWSCCVGMLAVGVNGTAIMAALPTMRADLGLDATDLTWAVNSYLLASAACIILGGTASDRLGSRRVALVGLVLFSAASVAIALATGPGALLLGRTAQGLGAALAVPGTLAAVGQVGEPKARASALGTWAGALLLGFSLGPLIGGAITHGFGWRPVFGCAAALLAASAAGMFGASRSEPAPRPSATGGFDAAGFLLLAGGMVMAVLALQGLGRAGAEPLAFWLPLVAAPLLVGLFVRTERRRAHPFVDLAAVASAKDFARSGLIGAASMFCILPTLLFFNLYAQGAQDLRFTPVEAGLALLPMSAGLFVVARRAPALVQRFTAAQAIPGAFGIVAAGAVLVATASRAGPESPLPLGLLLLGLLLLGAGLALPYATAPRLALGALPPGAAGQSSGLINACTFLGGSLGIACGSLVYPVGGLPAVMGAVAAVALLGLVAARGVATGEARRPRPGRINQP